MKRNKISARWQIYLFLLLFSFVLIGLLWLFQIVYLDDFYAFIKNQEAKATYAELTSLIEKGDENLDAKLDKIAMKHNAAIFLTSEDNSYTYYGSYNVTSSLSNMPMLQYYSFVEAAEENGGSYEIKFIGNENVTIELPDDESLPDLSGNSDSLIPEDGTSDNDQNQGKGSFHQNRGMENGVSIIYVEILDSPDYGDNMVLMVNTVLSPLDSTVETLKFQLIVITVILILLALLFGYIVSKWVSKPIISTNEAAKKLAEGDFAPNFQGGSYKEICELADTLNFAAEELGKSERYQRELIANVSHDLRTPLTMIGGYAEVMRDIPGENTPENVQVIIDESNRLTTLVNDMLDMSKLQSGALTLNVRDYNLTASMENVLTRYNKLREQEGYHIEFLYDRAVYVHADEEKIYQVLYNLVNNAVNYTGEDKTVIVTQTEKDGRVRLEVKDSGIGIPKEELKNVWERYYKVDKTHKRSVQGSGLGLSIVKNILKLHNASFGVESEVGVGSTFWFELDEISAPLDN